MKLQEQIQNDFAQLAKEKNNPKKELLKVVLAELSRYKSKDVPDEEVVRIVKKMKENAVECGNLDEVPILEEYLPTMYKDWQIKIMVEGIIQDHHLHGMSSIGLVMKELQQQPHSSLIDKGIASKIAKELLG